MSNGQQHRRVPQTFARLAAVAALALLAGLIAPSQGNADPAGTPQKQHQPTISEVSHQLTTLHEQAEAAAESYNRIKVRTQQASAHLATLRSDVTRQRARVDALRTAIVSAALSDYESTGGLSTSASFLVAKRPSQFIDELASDAIVEHQQANLLSQYAQQQKQFGAQQKQAGRELAALTADRARLTKQKTAVENKLADAKKLLAHLKAQQRARLLAEQRRQAEQWTPPSRGGSRPPVSIPTPPASGRAAIAVKTALAQLGKPYVWGAAGPNAFDCSGLTMYAWAAAGVHLSHASYVQSHEGVPVSISDLEPGDLVFYYSPVHHVAMYIGNGLVVHAPYPGTVVQIAPLTSMPISWARRVG